MTLKCAALPRFGTFTRPLLELLMTFLDDRERSSRFSEPWTCACFLSVLSQRFHSSRVESRNLWRITCAEREHPPAKLSTKSFLAQVRSRQWRLQRCVIVNGEVSIFRISLNIKTIQNQQGLLRCDHRYIDRLPMLFSSYAICFARLSSRRFQIPI